MNAAAVTSPSSGLRARPLGLATLFAALAALLFVAAAYWMYEHEQKHMRRSIVATADAHVRWAGLLLVQSLDHQFADRKAAKTGLPPSFEFDAKTLLALDQVARAFGTRTPIAKIKIYNADGRTIYSTSPAAVKKTRSPRTMGVGMTAVVFSIG